MVPSGSPSLWALFVVLSSPPAVLSLCGCCALFSFWFHLLQGGCASGLRCLGHTLAARFVQSRLPFVVVLSFTCSCGTGCLVAVFDLSCCSCGLSSRGVSAAAFCPLGLLSHPLLLLFLPGFLPLAFVQAWVGRLRSCHGSSLLLGGALLPLSSLFSLGCSNCLLSRLLEFLELGFLSSRFQCLLIARGGCRLVLGFPRYVAWLREVLPRFSVRGLSACPSGAAVPLGSSVLRGSGSSRWGHLCQVGTVFFLSPRS